MSDNGAGGASLTHFAPAERDLPEQVQAAAAFTANDPLASKLLEAVDGCAVILNRQRQIVAANHQFLDVVGAKDLSDVLGERPGEALQCATVEEAPGGCGTAQACETCGAVLAVLAAQHGGGPAERECLLTTKAGSGLQAGEYRVRATSMTLNETDFVVAVMHDISAEKRRDALERVFFHDALNTLNALSGWAVLLERLDHDAAIDAVRRIEVLCRRLTRAIQDQRVLRRAERGELAVTLNRTIPSWILSQARAALLEDTSLDDRLVKIVSPDNDDVIETDTELLVRVLVLMLRNALEAGGREVAVEMECRSHDGVPEFSVWNLGHIPPEVSRQVFKRSFTTKTEPGRGLGTYSMKLFGEQLLGGEVTFATSPEEGTRFSIRLPPMQRDE